MFCVQHLAVDASACELGSRLGRDAATGSQRQQCAQRAVGSYQHRCLWHAIVWNATTATIGAGVVRLLVLILFARCAAASVVAGKPLGRHAADECAEAFCGIINRSASRAESVAA